MVVSVNPDPHRHEFVSLMDQTILELNTRAKVFPEKIEKLTGTKLENYTCDVLSEFAVGTPFEGSIEVKSGIKFPDLIVNRFYGIEVKTTTKNHWKSTGNSVLESTRVEDVERIFILFGKLGKPIEFKHRPYEECLSEVVVTHSPRYLIDMNLGKGDTIFDKMGISYDTLRQENNPIKPITEYYKSNLKPGQDLWWIQNSERANSLIINIWKNISSQERVQIRNHAMVIFPEIFGHRQDKFNRFALWLVKTHSVVCPNARDPFTAGGVDKFVIGQKVYENVPRIFLNLFKNIDEILSILKNTPATELSEYWQIQTSEKSKIKDWANQIELSSIKFHKAKHLDVKSILNQLV